MFNKKFKTYGIDYVLSHISSFNPNDLNAEYLLTVYIKF